MARLRGVCGLCPIFAARFSKASNLGQASGSKSRLAPLIRVGLAFLRFLGLRDAVVAMTKNSDTPIEDCVSAEVFKAMGILIARASACDLHVGIQILRLIGTETTALHAFPVVSGMDFKVKLSIIRMLVALYHPEASEKISRICDKLQEKYGRRNTVAHSLLTPGKTKDRPLFMPMRPDAELKDLERPKPLNADDLLRWASELTKFGQQLSAALSELGYPGARAGGFGEPTPQPG